MPAKSKAQQRFMGMVHAVQKGELSPSKVSKKIKDVADDMSDSDAEDFASTKHKGKPEKVAKEVIRKIREVLKPIVRESYASMFGEFTKDMRSSYEVQAAKELADEYDIGKVLYVFRTNPRAFDKAIKDKMKEMKTFNKAKKLKEGRRLSSHQKKAISIAIEMSGNMTNAVKKIERIKKGLSNDKKVKAALRLANESISVNEAVKDPKLKVGQKIRHKNDPRKVYTLKKITHGNRGIPEDPAGTSYMFVAPGNKKEFHTKKTWAQALKKKWIIPEGKRATKGFKKAFKSRNDFFIAMSDFRKKLGDMGTDPKIFKLEGELYKFEVEFQKKSAKILDFMQRLSKSPITEGTINEIDYGNVFADMGDKLSDFKMKVVKPGMRLYNKGKAKFYMRDLYKSLEKCVDLCDMMNLMANESVVEQWRPYKPLLEKIIKIKKDPHKGVKNTAKGKRFNPLLLKGEDKIKALVWSGSHPTGKGSYELKGNKLNVMGLNPRDKGFYVSHFTKNTGIRRGNLYYDGVHWQGKKQF